MLSIDCRPTMLDLMLDRVPRAALRRSPLDLMLAQLPFPAHPAGQMELSKTEDGYGLSVATPGVSASDLTISCDRGVLSLTGASSSSGSHIRFQRQVALPEDADVERATATHEHGLLHVSLPTKPRAEPRSLELVPLSEQPVPDDSAHYRVALPAAGIAPRDLTVTVLEGEVTLSGRSKSHGVEYSIDRAIILPRDADAEGVAASLVDGILTLTVPRAERATGQEAKRLQIRAEGQHADGDSKTDGCGCNRSVPAASMDESA